MPPVVVTPQSDGPQVDLANSQFHAQDDFGQYNYGLSHSTQTKMVAETLLAKKIGLDMMGRGVKQCVTLNTPTQQLQDSS